MQELEPECSLVVLTDDKHMEDRKTNCNWVADAQKYNVFTNADQYMFFFLHKGNHK